MQFIKQITVLKAGLLSLSLGLSSVSFADDTSIIPGLSDNGQKAAADLQGNCPFSILKKEKTLPPNHEGKIENPSTHYLFLAEYSKCSLPSTLLIPTFYIEGKPDIVLQLARLLAMYHFSSYLNHGPLSGLGPYEAFAVMLFGIVPYFTLDSTLAQTSNMYDSLTKYIFPLGYVTINHSQSLDTLSKLRLTAILNEFGENHKEILVSVPLADYSRVKDILQENDDYELISEFQAN